MNAAALILLLAAGLAQPGRVMPPEVGARLGPVLRGLGPEIVLDTARIGSRRVKMRLCRGPGAGSECFEAELSDPEEGCEGSVVGPWCLSYPGARPAPEIDARLRGALAGMRAEAIWRELVPPQVSRPTALPPRARRLGLEFRLARFQQMHDRFPELWPYLAAITALLAAALGLLLQRTWSWSWRAPALACCALGTGLLAIRVLNAWGVVWAVGPEPGFALTLLVAGALLWLGREHLVAAVARPTDRRGFDVPLLLALLLLAVLLRAVLGPFTFLEEAMAGVEGMDAVTGHLIVGRPKSGEPSLMRLMGLLVTMDRSTVIGINLALGALQAPLVYLLARVLGLGRLPALVSGLVVAALPMLVRMGSSEDSFQGATAFLLAAATCAVAAARTRSGPLLLASAVLVAIAGLFRPVMFSTIAPLAIALLLLGRPGGLRYWLRSPWAWAAVVAFAVLIFEDARAILDAGDYASNLTAGWQNRMGVRGWPLLDSGVTPAWFLPASGAGAALAMVLGGRARRRAVLWLSLLLLWLSYLYSSSNGHPAALRYAVAYAWIPALLLGLGTDAIAGRSPRIGLAAVAGLAALILLMPMTYRAWIGARWVEQKELDFQDREVIPALSAGPPGVVITPWNESSSDRLGGSLQAWRVRAAGHRIVPVEQAAELLKDPPAGAPVYWYLGLTCWRRPTSDPRPDVRLRRRCAAVDRLARWVPVAETRLDPSTEADWLVYGDGSSAVRVGLYRLVRPGALATDRPPEPRTP